LSSNGPDVQERLREGVEAARRGDRVTARRLLQQVLIIDRDNEVALMWMASAVDTLAERRAFLERALKLNPENARAREALQRMGVNVGGDAGGDIPLRAPAERRADGKSGSNLYLIAALGVALVTAVVVIVAVLSSRQQTTTTLNPQQAADATFLAILAPTQDQSAEVVQGPPPTETPFIGVIVTLDTNQEDFPPTFTPTDTPRPAPTLTPTATSVPPSAYEVLLTTLSDDVSTSGLSRAFADASRLRRIGNAVDGYDDATISPDGTQVVFVRSTRAEGAGDDAPITPQLFAAPIARLDDAVAITNLGGNTLSSPSFSPDGTLIVFTSNQDGDNEIWFMNADGSSVRQLTTNTENDSSPVFSPDGTRIAYASDALSPGFSEIYEYNLETDSTIRLTDEAGENYAPAYSPDGTRIAFISTRGADGDIYIMDSNGQRKVLLTLDDDGAEDSAPVFTPDGEYIAFVSNRGEDTSLFGVYLFNIRTGGIEQIFDGTEGVQTLAFFPITR